VSPPLTGQDKLLLDKGATLIFSHPRIKKNLYIHSGANSIKWTYELNTATIPTIGGEVTQILSTYVGPITITGQTAGMRVDGGNPKPKVKGYLSSGGYESYNPNDEMYDIISWFHSYMEGSGADIKGQRLRDERAILFQYPERGWDFYIQVTNLSGFSYDKSVYAPEWSITAEIVDDNALNFFRGITMHSFTDNLTNQNLLAKIGMSAFGNSETFKNTQGVFGQDGNSKNPFLNPEISGQAADLARTMGNNFQGLVAAWSTGDFANFGFNSLLNNDALPKDVDAAYMKLFGTTYLGGAPGFATSTGGTSTYTVKSGVQAAPWVEATLKAGGWPITKENLAFLAGWGRIEGADQARQIAGNNWMNSTQDYAKYPGFISSNGAHIAAYPTRELGAQYTAKTINNGNYPDVIGALKSGNPYTNPPLEGLQTWVAGSTRNADTLKYANLVMGANATVVADAGAPAGAASGVRLSVINWAYKFIAYGDKNGKPTYDQAGRKDVENIAPGDFSALTVSDCSNSVALLYCWGTNKNRAYATGSGGTFNGSYTGSMYNNFRSKIQPLEKLKAGDLIIYGPASNTVHVDMLLEQFRGDNTLMFSHGSGTPHKTTWGNVSSGRKASATGFQVLPI